MIRRTYALSRLRSAVRWVKQPTHLPGPNSLDGHIPLGFRLLQRAAAFQHQLDLGDIELPPIVGSPADREALRAAAPLYLAAELESTRLLPVVEVLGGLAVTGGLTIDLGSAGPALVEFWRKRRDRLTADEREAIFGRVFGKQYGPAMAVADARNTNFEFLMIDFADAVASFGRDPVFASGPGDAVRVAITGREVAYNLIPRTGGVVTFAGQEILMAIKEALEVVKAPGVQRAVGAASVWQAVRLGALRYLGQRPNIGSHLARGKSGMELLAWLAQALPEFDAGAAIQVPVTMVTASVSWLQATLVLEERRADPFGG